MNDWKRGRIELARREYVRKTTDAAYMRMRTRTAKEQHADALQELKGLEEIPLPDADDSIIRGVMR
jgi:hypothetical protein